MKQPKTWVSARCWTQKNRQADTTQVNPPTYIKRMKTKRPMLTACPPWAHSRRTLQLLQRLKGRYKRYLPLEEPLQSGHAPTSLYTRNLHMSTHLLQAFQVAPWDKPSRVRAAGRPIPQACQTAAPPQLPMHLSILPEPHSSFSATPIGWQRTRCFTPLPHALQPDPGRGRARQETESAARAAPRWPAYPRPTTARASAKQSAPAAKKQSAMWPQEDRLATALFRHRSATAPLNPNPRVQQPS